MNFFKKAVAYFNKSIEEHPLRTIIVLGLFFRLIAVIFSKGYGMHDDHFLIIEASQSWVDGYDYNNWLPKENSTEITPSGHSFFYTGLHFFLFWFLKIIGITGAQSKMYIVRLLHALFSLITIIYGYKITIKLSDKKSATMVGLLLAVLWFMPFLSVRNLIEVVCVPPLVYATWLLIKNEEKSKLGAVFLAGLILGIAFSIRFQTILFTGGLGLALLLQKKFLKGIILGSGFLIAGGAIQGITDYFIWGVPFVEFKEYVRYNIESAGSYGNMPWYNYLLLMGGILIPPISLFLLFGFFRSWKKYLLLFLPSFIFLAFHSYFPNKQERFILPIVPFVVILGYIGWYEFVTQSTFWKARQNLLKYCWIFFWCINTIPLVIVSGAYSKRNRVEAMCYIAKKGDVTNIIIEDGNRDDILMPPRFYLEKWISVYGITKQSTAENLYNAVKTLDKNNFPNYVVFMQEENIEERIKNFKTAFKNVEYEATIKPSFIDAFVHWLNPVNKNQVCFVYKINR